MNEQILRKYRSERAKGMSAASALQFAKGTSADPKYAFLAKLDADSTVKGAIGPFKVKVSVVPDEDGQLGEDDVTGVFTDEYEEGCVKNTRRNWGTDYKYYRPSNYVLTNAYEDFRTAGMSKGVARDAVRELVEEEMGDDASRQYYGIEVTVKVAGKTLGHGSLWNIDTIFGYESAPYFIEVAQDIIEDALREAREAIPAAIEENATQARALAEALAWSPESAED